MRWVWLAAAALLTCGTLAAQPRLEPFPPVMAGRVFEFPRDHGSHPQFKTEWWYVTGTVTDEAGESLGFQVTFFRQRTRLGQENPSRFVAEQMLFAHAAVSERQHGQLRRADKVARAGFGLAEAHEGGMNVYIDDWRLHALPQERVYRTQVKGADFSFDLQLRETQSPLLHGDAGYSRRGPDPLEASYYYSLPHLGVSGRVWIDGRERSVTGTAWLDREWHSEIMTPAMQGWDWIGIQLEHGGALMAFHMRNTQGGTHWSTATLRSSPSAAPEFFGPEAIEWIPQRFWRSPRTGVEYPVEWVVKLGARTLRIVPSMDDQENDTRGSTGTIYWEGVVRVLDEVGQTIGQGYLELTGYGARLSF